MPNTEMQPMTLVEKHLLNDTTLLMKLKPSKTFDYQSGQYVMLGLTPTELKPFSIASAPKADGLIELHIRNQDNSEWMQDLFALDTGATLYIQGPNDQYHLDAPEVLADKQRTIFVAGGTGFAPMFALLESLLERGHDRPIEFYWGAQIQADLYRDAEMKALAGRHPSLHYITVLSGQVDESAPEKLVHHQVLNDFPDLSDARVYLCGPWPMQEAAKADFIAAGLPSDAFN